MSYDLTLFHAPEGSDAELVYEELMAEEGPEGADLDSWLKRPIPDSTRSEMRRLANALKSWRPSLKEFQPPSPLPWIELNEDTLEVQFGVHARTVEITMPYFRPRAREMMECAAGCFAVLKAVAGYVAYDPQLERVVTAADLDEMVAQYQSTASVTPDILAPGPQAPAPAPKPWWKFW